MCIIIAKKAEDEFSEKELIDASKTASIHNCHGVGFAVKKAGSNNIILSKGYKYHELAIQRLMEFKIQKGDEFMFHMRYATSGHVDDINCHPFIISSKIDEIITPEVVVSNKSVVSHNGTFDYYVDKESEYSDTVHYIENYLSAEDIIPSMRSIEDASYYQLYSLLRGNRLCIMHPNEDMDIFGSWNTRKNGKLLYSNYYHIQPHNGYILEEKNKMVN